MDQINAERLDETVGSEQAVNDHRDENAASDDAMAGKRLQRIEQLQSQALANPDPLAANLGAANGALMRIGFRLEEALEGALAKVPSPTERFDRLVPAIETYLKVMRQVDRFSQLEQRLSAGSQPKPR